MVLVIEQEISEEVEGQPVYGPVSKETAALKQHAEVLFSFSENKIDLREHSEGAPALVYSPKFKPPTAEEMEMRSRAAAMVRSHLLLAVTKLPRR